MLERLKNLWRLSELEVPEKGKQISDYPSGTTIIDALIKPKKATFIKYEKKNATEQFLEEANKES